MEKFTRRWREESLQGIFITIWRFFICGDVSVHREDFRRKLTAIMGWISTLSCFSTSETNQVK
jgi:hypothetical protein